MSESTASASSQIFMLPAQDGPAEAPHNEARPSGPPSRDQASRPGFVPNSSLGVIREHARQRTFWPRLYAVLETLYQGMMGWRAGRICGLLHLFGDQPRVGAQGLAPLLQEGEDHQKLLGETGGPTERVGEPQYQELLRLLDEEIAHVQEEFQYAEKVNEEKSAVERDACLAPVGEAWSTMVRQQAALDRSIDRKVRILLALRKELPTADLPDLPIHQTDDAEMEEINRILDMDIPRSTPSAQCPAIVGTGSVSSFVGPGLAPALHDPTHRGEPHEAGASPHKR